MKQLRNIFILFAVLGLAGCASTTERALDSNNSQVELRSMQTRTYDNISKEAMLKAVINTLQDLEFVIDKADALLGAVSATKLTRGTLKMTVTVREKGATQVMVRANAQFGIRPIKDPEPYQDFFNALNKSVFLSTHNVD